MNDDSLNVETINKAVAFLREHGVAPVGGSYLMPVWHEYVQFLFWWNVADGLRTVGLA